MKCPNCGSSQIKTDCDGTVRLLEAEDPAMSRRMRELEDQAFLHGTGN